MRTFASFLVLTLLALVAGASPLQESESGPQSSPRATMFTFLSSMRGAQEGDEAQWDAAVECLDLSGVLADRFESQRRATALWDSLNHVRVVEQDQLPGDAEVGDALTFIYFPKLLDSEDREILDAIDYGGQRIAMALGDGGLWRFDAATVAEIYDLEDALGTLDAKVSMDADLEGEPLLRQWMPQLLLDGFLEIEYWQWAGLLVLVLLGLVVEILLGSLLLPLLRAVIARWHATAEADSLKRTLRPIGWLGTGLVWLLLVHVLGFEGAAQTILVAAAKTFTTLSGTWAAWNIVDLLGEIFTIKAQETQSTIDDVLVPLVRKAIKVFVAAFGLIYAAQSLGANIVPLITGLGIGGLAFAFAAKDTIENFFGSVAVILDRPFEVGDWVVIGDVEGTIEDLGFRSTRVRTFYNSQVTLPNASLVRATVDNYGRRRYRRWNTTLAIQYDTTPDQILAFTEGIRELVRTHPFTRKDYFQVRCREFGASSLDILLYVFFDVPEWSTELRERERLLVDILRLADRLGVQFAFPTQTLHIGRIDPNAADQPGYEIPRAEADHSAAIDGIRAAKSVIANQPWQHEKPGPVVFVGKPTDLDPSDPTQTTEDTKSPRS